MQTTIWGIFCACSWTWCIGMYMPIIMINRLGWLGFAAFAIPNVIGCAAFGYRMRNSNTSRAMLSVPAHRRVAIAFSIITIAFHLFFLSFLAHHVLRSLHINAFDVEADLRGAASIAIPIVMFAMCLGLSFLGNRTWLILSVLTYALSITTLIILFNRNGTDFLTFDLASLTGGAPIDLIWVLPALCFGFLLCPYLDLTFHRALAESPSRHAFLIFSLAFTVMLILTVVMWLSDTSLALLAVVHIAAQSVFTMGAHMREVRERFDDDDDTATSAMSREIVLFLPLLAIAILPLMNVAGHASSGEAEDMYLRWFVFYGLVFPGYVLLFLRKDSMGNWSRPRPNMLIAAAGVMIALMPCYEFAFLHQRRMWLLAIPMALAALFAIFGRRNAKLAT
ncbi:MAG: hypothetical protein ACR2GY_09105 [Phycisphaerales bacterium]